MRQIGIIYRRELSSFIRSWLGYTIAALMLLILGILYQSMALGGKPKLSAEVIREFFRLASGVTMVTGVVLSFWQISFERQNGSSVLYSTSPVRDYEIVAGKFLAALTFLSAVLALSVYMPLLIKVRGKVSGAEIFIGYLGLFLLGAAVLAIGLFASALTSHVLFSAAVAATITVLLVLLFPLSKILDEPLKHIVANFDLWALHFAGFMGGVLHLKDVVYYLALTYFFLLLAVKAMEAKRWQ